MLTRLKHRADAAPTVCQLTAQQTLLSPLSGQKMVVCFSPTVSRMSSDMCIQYSMLWRSLENLEIRCPYLSSVRSNHKSSLKQYCCDRCSLILVFQEWKSNGDVCVQKPHKHKSVYFEIQNKRKKDAYILWIVEQNSVTASYHRHLEHNDNWKFLNFNNELVICEEPCLGQPGSGVWSLQTPNIDTEEDNFVD